MLDRLIQRFPVLTAALLYTVVTGLAFWHFWGGAFLINDFSDAKTGYAFRQFAADYLRAHHDVPQWDPYIFGGLPFAAGHGDAFYPTALLRLIFPVDVGISLGFLIHIVLAGLFTFLFLRALRLSWGSAFVGGAAYLFTGQVVSMVSPGHDGKLYVSALLPLAFMFLYQAVTTGSWRRYLCFGATIGFCLLSPHYQMTYYLLMGAGFFWAYLVFLGGERPVGHRPVAALGFFVGAVLAGFTLASVQVLPFYEYLAFSPRAATDGSSSGWEYATSWAMPPEELIGTVWPAFSGMLENYWGRNPFKLHSEYLGVSVLMLASFGFRLEGRRHLAWFFVFLAAFATIFSFGGHTPFYYIPYYLLPGIKLTRAAGMMFFLTAFSTATLAAMGAEALGRPDRQAAGKPGLWWVGAMAGAAILAAAGGWQPIMQAFAQPERFGAIASNYPNFQLDALRVLLVAALMAVLCWRPLPRVPALWGLAAGGVILLDLWSVERHFIRWSPPAAQTFAADGVVTALKGESAPFRVLPLGVYHDTYLMTHGIRSVLGYHGNEVHRYDDLLGGKNLWQNAGSQNLWHLLAVKYVVVPQKVEVPGLTLVQPDAIETNDHAAAFLYRVDQASPFAYLVREAIKLPDKQTIPTLMDPRFDPRRLLLVPPDAPVGVASLSSLPDSLPGRVLVEAPRAGAFRFTLETPPAAPAFLFVAENHFQDWHARVDGQPVPVVRAQYSLMAVPVPAGSRVVELEYSSPWDRAGRGISTVMLLGLLGLAAANGIAAGRRAGG